MQLNIFATLSEWNIQ